MGLLNLILFLAKLLVLVILSFTLKSGVLYADSVNVLFSPNGGVKERLLSKISEASCSIDAALYSFSDKDIWNLLEDKVKEGLAVRLILNKSSFKDSYSKCKYCDKLLDVGAKIKFHSLTMHHKFAVFDKSCSEQESSVVTGSGNWSRSSNLLYDEDFLEFNHSSQAVSSFAAEFDYVWNYSRQFPSLKQEPLDMVQPAVNADFIFTSSNMTPKKFRGRWTFSKKKGVEKGAAGKKIIAAIHEAESEILIATAHFRRKDIFEALLDAYKRGVKIQLITDGQEYNKTHKSTCENASQSDKQLDECLQILGAAEVYYKYYSVVWNYKTAKQMHSKYIVIDRKRVLTGSFNWSLTAEFKNLENIIDLKGNSIANHYLENFQKILSYGVGELAGLKSKMEKSEGKSPCHFSPITVAGKEISHIRKVMKKGSCR
jgi:phosphatidylserine/phosphatidylglycerophosphate/cardiolipin synthase-like enzyme